MAPVAETKTLLRKLRRDLDLTIEALAVRTRINPATLSLVERRRRPASDDVKRKLEKFFKRPADELLSSVAA